MSEKVPSRPVKTGPIKHLGPSLGSSRSNRPQASDPFFHRFPIHPAAVLGSILRESPSSPSVIDSLAVLPSRKRSQPVLPSKKSLQSILCRSPSLSIRHSNPSKPPFAVHKTHRGQSFLSPPLHIPQSTPASPKGPPLQSDSSVPPLQSVRQVLSSSHSVQVLSHASQSTTSSTSVSPSGQALQSVPKSTLEQFFHLLPNSSLIHFQLVLDPPQVSPRPPTGPVSSVHVGSLSFTSNPLLFLLGHMDAKSKSAVEIHRKRYQLTTNNEIAWLILKGKEW